MILTAIGIFFNVDRKFQTFFLNNFPQYGVGLTKFEDNELIRNQLNKMAGTEVKKEDMGKPLFNISTPKGPIAPELIPGGVWFNSEPLTLAELKGKVVIIDFWTYSCINCQRTMPYLTKWWETYKHKGLIIIGVHSPEFEFEKNEKNLARAIKDFKLPYPIMQDNDFATWKAYNNHYWPAKYIIDKDGYIRSTHFGEDAYDETEKVIQDLLKKIGDKDVSSKINNPTYQVQTKTPEIYLGSARNPYKSGFTLTGDWNVMKEYANPQKGAKLILDFESKEVFLVMRNKNTPATVQIYLDDTLQDSITIDADRLYKLINLQTPGRHILRLEFDDNNTELYAFTFV